MYLQRIWGSVDKQDSGLHVKFVSTQFSMTFSSRHYNRSIIHSFELFARLEQRLLLLHISPTLLFRGKYYTLDEAACSYYNEINFDFRQPKVLNFIIISQIWTYGKIDIDLNKIFVYLNLYNTLQIIKLFFIIFTRFFLKINDFLLSNFNR